VPPYGRAARGLPRPPPGGGRDGAAPGDGQRAAPASAARLSSGAGCGGGGKGSFPRVSGGMGQGENVRGNTGRSLPGNTRGREGGVSGLDRDGVSGWRGVPGGKVRRGIWASADPPGLAPREGGVPLTCGPPKKLITHQTIYTCFVPFYNITGILSTRIGNENPTRPTADTVRLLPRNYSYFIGIFSGTPLSTVPAQALRLRRLPFPRGAGAPQASREPSAREPAPAPPLAAFRPAGPRFPNGRPCRLPLAGQACRRGQPNARWRTGARRPPPPRLPARSRTDDRPLRHPRLTACSRAAARSHPPSRLPAISRAGAREPLPPLEPRHQSLRRADSRTPPEPRLM
jgi:hypothetical protein